MKRTRDIDVVKVNRDLARHGMSHRELAEKAGLSTDGVSHILSRGSCSYSSLDRLAVALGRHPSEIGEWA